MRNSKRLLTILLSFAIIFTPMFFLSLNKASAAVSTDRYYGNNRYDTAAAICNAGWSKSDNVVLAIGGDFPDALSATPLASKLNAPILLTEGVTLSSDLAAAITRLQAKNVFIIGGDDVISLAIENSLKSMNLKITRLYGDNRYLTCLQVANYIAQNFGVGSEAAIATGEDFPDALSIAAIAAKRGMPILLSEKNSLPAEVKTFIAQNNITTTYIVGGSDVVSDNVMNQLPGHERIFGDNRYDTNAAIINRFMGDLDFSTTYLATGEDFPDALSGSALAAKTASPVVLTYKSPDLSTSKVIDISSSSIAQLKIFGGDDVVPDSTVSFLAPVVNTIGNTVGNLENRGHAARQGSWIFYSFYYARQGSTGLYKSRVDNTGIQKLCDIQADHINVVGQWVYFNDNSFPVSMYKIRTDGTGGPVLLQSNAFLTNVIGDWIYYFGDGFCKMKTDGTEKTKISNLVGTGTVYGDWLYSAPESRIYKVKLDGTGFMKITDDNAWYMNVEGDWIYYTDYSGTDYYRALYKIRTDGTEKTLVNSEMSYCLNVQDGWIYYMNCNDGRKLYKIRPDGTGRTKITNEDTEEANILGDWIYYERVDSLNEIYEYYRVKMDGTGRERIQ